LAPMAFTVSMEQNGIS